MKTTEAPPTILVPDAIFHDHHGPTDPAKDFVSSLDRRTRWTATALVALTAVGAIAAAIVLTVSAALVAVIVFVLGLVVRIVASLASVGRK